MPPEDAPPPIRQDEVESIARLAHLELPKDQIHRMTADLAGILAYIKQLEELDVTGIEPTAYVELERPKLRPDEPHESFSQEIALREAPRVSMEGFAVPGFVEDDG